MRRGGGGFPRRRGDWGPVFYRGPLRRPLRRCEKTPGTKRVRRCGGPHSRPIPNAWCCPGRWGREGERYSFLDEFAVEGSVAAKSATVALDTLEKRARALRAMRDAEADSSTHKQTEELSRHGGFSGQFEPDQLRLPEILVGVWAYT